MTLTEYEQKKREDWEEFRIKNPAFNDMLGRKIFNQIYDRAYALGKQEKNAEGEEMLCSPKNIAFKFYDIANGSYRENGNEWFHGYMKAMVDLFGNIFPPIERTKESNEPETAEPSSQNSPENCDNADLISTDCDKQFDTTIKNSFSKERRLNIAAMAMQGILGNENMLQYAINNFRCPEGSRNRYYAVAQLALAHADALIAECNTPIT